MPGGFSYVWESSPNGLAPWTPLPSPVQPIQYPHVVISQSQPTYYHCVITCTATSATSTSSTLFVDALTCYTTPTTFNSNDTDIGQVIFGSLTNPGSMGSVQNNPLATGTYTNYTAIAPPTFAQGATPTITVNQITSGGTFWAAVLHVYIDWNQDGCF